jgi:hypothetical protein
MQVSAGFPGSFHDKKIWDLTFHQDKIATELAAHHFTIMGDKGYQGIQKQINAAIPFKQFHGKLTPFQVRYNENLNSSRAVLENFYSRMCQMFQILTHPWRGHISELDDIVSICIALTNLAIDEQPLRAGISH